MRKIIVQDIVYQFPKSRSRDARGASFRDVPHGEGLRWCAAGAVLGVVGSFAFPIFAALVTQGWRGISVASTMVRRLTAISTVSIVPLLIVGVYCLLQVVARSTPKQGCSARQIPDTSKDQRKARAVSLILVIFLCPTVEGKLQAQELPAAEANSGRSFEKVSGRLHVLDGYYTFRVNDKWTLAIEGDYVVGRVFRDSLPGTVWGGAGYANYEWTPRFSLRGPLEYLAEKVSTAGSLFSWVTQALKEGTLTAEYKVADGFLVRGEYRRDWSNQPFFLTEQPGLLKKEQNTVILGLIWWFGRKQGTW